MESGMTTHNHGMGLAHETAGVVAGEGFRGMRVAIA